MDNEFLDQVEEDLNDNSMNQRLGVMFEISHFE